jgi:hypothetical protein
LNDDTHSASFVGLHMAFPGAGEKDSASRDRHLRFGTMANFETLFPLGQLLATPGALAALAEANSNPLVWILRHSAGDWGSLT